MQKLLQKQNHAVCGLFRLAFTLTINALKIYPSYCIQQFLAHFNSCIIIHLLKVMSSLEPSCPTTGGPELQHS